MSVANPPEPSTIVRTAVGYMAAQQLFAASRIGVFRGLSDGPLTATQLARAIEADERIVRILADGMTSVGLLARDAGRYSLTDESAHYLGTGSGLDLAPFLDFLGSISLPHWLAHFDRTVDTGRPGELDLDAPTWERFLTGVHTYNELHAAMLSARFDFSAHRELLDFGGLSPAFTIGALRQNPQLRATVIFAPAFADEVRRAIDAAGLGDRARVHAGETESTVPEGSYDLVLASHVVHRFGPAENAAILANLRTAAAPGATLLLLDFFLDDEPVQRDLDALHAAEYFVIDGTIVYPRDEVEGWLTAAGWRPVDLLALPGSPRVLVAEAV